MRALSPSSLVVLVLLARSAAADDVIPGHHSDHATDGGVIGLALGEAALVSAVPIRGHALWGTELFGDADLGVRHNFSRRAALISDGLLAASLAAPVVYLMTTPIDDATGDRLLIYGESVAINAALVQTAKHLVQRPRPYVYSERSDVRRYAEDQGDDAYMSFYSGHAALTFGAAVTGAYLLGASTTSAPTRALAWGVGLATATATANLRVRAGKHYYSDVVVGALVGIAVGYTVPALHANREPYVPSGSELAAAAGGILLGALTSELMPLDRKHTEHAGSGEGSVLGRLQFAPMPLKDGMGFAVGGTL